MARKRRIRNIGRLVVLVVALAATYGLFAVAAMRVALRAREVGVPKVVGLEFDEAGRAMEAAGLTLRWTTVSPSATRWPRAGLPCRTRRRGWSSAAAGASESG